MRKQGIGGSDASAVIGRNPYKTNVILWKEKCGLSELVDIGDKPYVQYGQRAETPLIELFKLDYPQYDVKVEPYEIRRHKEYPFLLGTLDGELTERATGRKGILEIKTSNILSSMHKEKWNNRVPDNYYIQILHYLNVTGYEFAILKAHLKMEYNGICRIDTRHYYFEREDVLNDLRCLEEAEVAFWNENVLKHIEPALILPNL